MAFGVSACRKHTAGEREVLQRQHGREAQGRYIITPGSLGGSMKQYSKST